MPNLISIATWRTLASAGQTKAARFVKRLLSQGGPEWLLDGVRRKIRRVVTYVRAWVHRRRLTDVTFIGITGSAGKTTTKDLSATILSVFGPCESTFLSENEHVYIAQTILSATRRHRFCVVEVSANRPNYLNLPIRLLKPDIAVLTVIARDHFQAFKSIEAIAAEKGKLVAALPPDGTAVLNFDDPLVRSIGERCNRRVIWVGKGEGATLRLREARSQWPEPLTLHVEYEGKTFAVRTQLHGTHLALSVLAALGVALAAGLPLEMAMSALAQAQPAEGRMQIVTGDDGIVFLRDDWKAPYWSLQAPLEFMRDAQALRKVLIIGTLSDYSLSASKVYPKVAKQALEVGDLVLFVGPHALRGLKARRHPDDQALLAFPEIRDAAAYLRTALRAGDLVLLKGSNKADHLVRLILNRSKPVQCWREGCGLANFCGICPQLDTPSHAIADASTPPQMATSASDSTGLPALPETSGPAVLVVVGLGNPGAHDRHTPHNVGHRALDALADAAGSDWEEQPEGLVSTVVLGGIPVKLLKPGVNINLSGSMVQRFLDRVGSDPKHCIIVHDDMDIALGDVRLKRDGSDAGHRGVRSVISALGTGAIQRVRIGVRRPGDVRQARQVVLAKFSAGEETVLVPALEQAAEVVTESVQKGRGRDAPPA